MKGKIYKGEDNQWLVDYSDNQTLQLHPDDSAELIDLERIVDNIGARIAASSTIEFEIVENQKMDGVVKYAKLI